MLKQIFVAATLVSTLVVTGCESMPAQDNTITENLNLLQNRTWIATQIGNTPIKTAPNAHNIPSIQFDAASKRVSGADGCNRIMGGYNAGKDTITFGPIAATQMACLNNNGLDRQYHAALEKVTHYQVFGKTLKLLDRHGNLLIQYESAVQPR
ncbi:MULTISPECIES: META domain-containing protein [Acinetobacter]|uniref:META domain-containing protein n=1 Tax=Acinetobacter TaxID=469 RepID=UPI00144419E6|nr:MULTISPECIES: META domain-containing protein [Acinetobacter]UUS58071.1 META domain-containing protein [Acinetobacter sp. YH16040_T]UUS60398.1 META domain-containing protein [Acinetobacter sp. YH16056_T]